MVSRSDQVANHGIGCSSLRRRRCRNDFIHQRVSIVSLVSCQASSAVSAHREAESQHSDGRKLFTRCNMAIDFSLSSCRPHGCRPLFVLSFFSVDAMSIFYASVVCTLRHLIISCFSVLSILGPFLVGFSIFILFLSFFSCHCTTRHVYQSFHISSHTLARMLLLLLSYSFPFFFHLFCFLSCQS